MPILDPSLQNALLQVYSPNKSIVSVSFFMRYLQYASEAFLKNEIAFESSFVFKKDLERSLPFIMKRFGSKLETDDFNNPTIQNFYSHFYTSINSKYKKKFKKKGRYLCCYSKNNFKMNFYIPNTDFSLEHGWIFSTTPVAVLCIDTSKFNKKTYKDFFKLVSLEIDLMICSGYTLVLCISWKCTNINFTDLLLEIISSYPFAEIHMNLISTNKSSSKVLNSLVRKSDQIQSYFYLYSNFFTDNLAIESLKTLSKSPQFQIIQFSDTLINSFRKIDFTETQPFIYCTNGFELNKILINLSNVPLFESDDENDLIPTIVTDFGFGYILNDDFMNMNKMRVKILYNDPKCQKHVYKFINFDDIHLIRTDLYVTETLCLVETDSKTLKTVHDIHNKVNIKSDKNKEFKRETIFSLFKTKKMKKGLIYVAYAYQSYLKNFINNFNIHKTQIYTAVEACKTCLFNENNDLIKGVIYQVETGEGKACIIAIIAAVLALMKKTIHIASSNINLANRDYYQSYKFFNDLGIKTAVLLHFNELPFSTSSSSLNNMDNNIIYKKEFYPDAFFNKDLFENSSNMNFSVCGMMDNGELSKNTANVVFSTFVNFECFYLKMMEMCPNYISTYFSNCSLLIDEADSILIDELTNGTILSRSIKTNQRILTFIYESRLNKKPAKEVLKAIQLKWPKCNDINLDNIEEMFQEIDLVNEKEFVDGKKYSIETVKVKKKKKLKEILDNTKELIKSKLEESNGDKKVKKKKRKYNYIKKIVPFDYDHKGILEPNKQFNGFIQQFICIKEKLNNPENENLTIKPVSMNYLYVSHPIFVNLYSGVCGFTGTIGKKYDKRIFNDRYKLITKKIPRENPNLCVEYPFILCDNIQERNYKIIDEILYFHRKGNPVLVIFQDLNEISTFLFLLISKGIKNVNIFDGKNDEIKPDIIAGFKGAISLASNCCGRGTDIKNIVNYPLHVILTYYSSNSRVMNQAFGRTARQGQKGTVRVICLKDQFIHPIEIMSSKEMKKTLDDFQLKNEYQTKFIESFRKNREWIFSTIDKSQVFNDFEIQKLRSSTINVNRIIAFYYEFPICMSIKTFLDIQAQKIFSLYNCPNCKYTWMLFQKYIREMILESWSLFIENADRKYYVNKISDDYSDYLNSEIDKLYRNIYAYLPNNPKQFDIVPTFMHIFNKVLDNYQAKVMNSSIPSDLLKYIKQAGTKNFCTFTFGFKPYTLIDESGARINVIDGSDQKVNYIKDPELIYMQKKPNKIIPISITNKIDGIFDMICNKINEIIGGFVGLKFFMRRTLSGCEFGVCFDLDFHSNENNDLLTNQNILFDTDPLLLFTITMKSIAPALAGILIIALVYIASISKSIAEWINGFPVKLTSTLVKLTVKEIATKVINTQMNFIIGKLLEFLVDKLLIQIEELSKHSEKMADIFKVILKIINVKDFSNVGDQIESLFESAIKFNLNEFIFNNDLPTSELFKVGLILLLCFASFLLNFIHHQRVKYDPDQTAKNYDKNQDTKKALDENKSIVPVEKIKSIEFKPTLKKDHQ